MIAVIIGLSMWSKDGTTNSITIGSIGILSGEYATVGENIKNGITLAKEEWNASHSELQFEVISEDDGFDAKKGVSAYQKLLTIDKVAAVMNVSSPTIDAIYNEVTKHNFPVIQFGNQSVDPTNDNVIQVTAGNRPLELALGAFIKEKYPTNVAVYYGGDSVFTKFFMDFKDGYGEGLTEYPITQTGEDARETATKIIAQKHEVVVIIAAPTAGAKLVNELLKLSPNPIQFAFDANMQSGITDYERIIGDVTKLDGAYVMAILTDKDQNFAQNYKNRFGSEPGFWADYGYDGFMTLAKNYNSDAQKWTDAIKQSNVKGASGKISFDEMGVLNPVFELQRLQGGKFVTE